MAMATPHDRAVRRRWLRRIHADAPTIRGVKTTPPGYEYMARSIARAAPAAQTCTRRGKTPVVLVPRMSMVARVRQRARRVTAKVMKAASRAPRLNCKCHGEKARPVAASNPMARFPKSETASA